MDSKTKSFIFFFSFNLIIILIVIIFFISPNIFQIKRLSEAIYEERIRLESLYNQGLILKKVKEELNRVAPQTELLQNLFIFKGQELIFITALEELALKNKIEQEINLDISQQKEIEKDYKAIPLRLVLRGSFLEIFKYLLELERLDYYLNINSLHLESISKIPYRDRSSLDLYSSKGVGIQAIVSLLSYWREKP